MESLFRGRVVQRLWLDNPFLIDLLFLLGWVRIGDKFIHRFLNWFKQVEVNGMEIHLVGGFLGSGKTTAIINAAKSLMAQGKKVGVVTNDQGKYLVDTAFFRLASIPAVEVTGGCFCCNYDDLDKRLDLLVETAQPDVIFAESVGSCADLVATVIRPMLVYGGDRFMPASFSVFVDARLLRRRLAGQPLPFGDDVVYIFDKQLEEAGLIVVNKMDLLSEKGREEMPAQMAERFPNVKWLMQTSLTQEGVQPWLGIIGGGTPEGRRLLAASEPLEIDYARYGTGEAQLAWLDEEVQLTFPEGQGRALLHGLMSRFTGELAKRNAGIGHLKFIVQSEGSEQGKISFTALESPDWESQIPDITGDRVDLLVNARVEMGAEPLQALFRQVLEESGMDFSIRSSAAFHPGQPKPTHRMRGSFEL